MVCGTWSRQQPEGQGLRRLEDRGGLFDGRRPGDVIVYNWEGNKHLLIDVAVIDPTGDAHEGNLIQGGVGWAATCYEKRKWDRYPDIDHTKYEFMPFILETHGGASKVATEFCKKLEKIRLSRTCVAASNKSQKIELMIALNLEVQRFNSISILERIPNPEPLAMELQMKYELSLESDKDNALRRLEKMALRPCGNFGWSRDNEIIGDFAAARLSWKLDETKEGNKAADWRKPPEPDPGTKSPERLTINRGEVETKVSIHQQCAALESTIQSINEDHAKAANILNNNSRTLITSKYSALSAESVTIAELQPQKRTDVTRIGNNSCIESFTGEDVASGADPDECVL